MIHTSPFYLPNIPPPLPKFGIQSACNSEIAFDSDDQYGEILQGIRQLTEQFEGTNRKRELTFFEAKRDMALLPNG